MTTTATVTTVVTLTNGNGITKNGDVRGCSDSSEKVRRDTKEELKEQTNVVTETLKSEIEQLLKERENENANNPYYKGQTAPLMRKDLKRMTGLQALRKRQLNATLYDMANESKLSHTKDGDYVYWKLNVNTRQEATNGVNKQHQHEYDYDMMLAYDQQIGLYYANHPEWTFTLFPAQRPDIKQHEQNFVPSSHVRRSRVKLSPKDVRLLFYTLHAPFKQGCTTEAQYFERTRHHALSEKDVRSKLHTQGFTFTSEEVKDYLKGLKDDGVLYANVDSYYACERWVLMPNAII